MKKILYSILLSLIPAIAFAQGGFDVKGALSPLGNYAIAYNYNIRGVSQNVQHLTGRDSILTAKGYLVSPGLLVFVADSSKTYRLRPNLTTWDEFGVGVVYTASGGVQKVGNNFIIDPTYTALLVPYSGANQTLNLANNSMVQSNGTISTGINPGVMAVLNSSTNASIEIHSNFVSLTENGTNTAFIKVHGLVSAVNDTISRYSGTLALMPRANGTGGDSLVTVVNNVFRKVAPSTITGAFAPIASPTFTGTVTAPFLTLSGNASPTYGGGRSYYDTSCECYTIFNNDNNISLQVGQEEWIRVLNNSGSTIANGAAIYISGASGGLPTIALAQANSGTTTIGVGLATESISNGAIGYVTSLGVVHGLNTSTFSIGPVYISEVTPGALTQTIPSSPNFRYRIGIVTVIDASVGAIHVTPSTAMPGNGTGNQLLGMNSGGTAQEYKSIFGTSAGALGLGIAPTLAGLQIALTSTAVSGVARGIYYNGTVRATASNDILAKLDLSGGTFDFLTGATGLNTTTASIGPTTAGSGYTNGSYLNVTLTGGSPTVAATANITVAGGVVTIVRAVTQGSGYALGNTLSAPAASIGGTGSGFTSVLTTGTLAFTGTSSCDIRLAPNGNGTSILPSADNSSSIGSSSLRLNSIYSSGMVVSSWVTPGNTAVNILNASTGSYASFGIDGGLLLTLGETQTFNGYRLEAAGAGNFRGNGLLLSGVNRGFYLHHTLAALANNDVLSELDISPTFDNNTTAIQTLGTITGGSGYTNGTSTLVLTGGSPTIAATASIVRSGGVVTSVTPINRGKGYTTSDVLSATIPGGGSGFSVPVTAVGLTGVTDLAIRTNAPIGISGSSNGIVTLGVQAAAGTYNLLLPNAAPTANQFLTQNSGNTALTWGTLNSVSNYLHTIFTPTTGGTVSTVNNSYNIINPAGTLLALTVNLPSSPNNNDVVYIKYTQSITTVTYGNGTVVDGITSPVGGGLVILVYDSATTSWY
jgi:hypothetical protein